MNRTRSLLLPLTRSASFLAPRIGSYKYYSPLLSYASQRRSYSQTPIKRIGVIGAGQMGGGIAQTISQVAKLDVLLLDTKQEYLVKAMDTMEKLLTKNVAKKKMTEDEKKDTLKRITTTMKFEDFKDIDFVIEAVTENIVVKERIFKELSSITPPHAILASNTSSISITRIASFTNRPDKVIGMHFMNPVPVMKLVEVISGLATSPLTLSTTLRLAEDMGKTTAQSDDRPGFIANRLLLPYLNDAINALQDGLGTREAIDTTMKLGCNMPMGPLQLADFIGLDTCLFILQVMHSELGDRYKPSPLLVKYVNAGWLGVKSGQGFYSYSVKNSS